MTTPHPPGAGELKRVFAKLGIRPNRGRGQNFMVDPNILSLLVDSAEIGPTDVILEPGPGPGGLTALLAERATRVIAVEVDRKLHSLAVERLTGLANVHILHGDIMGARHTVNPAALHAVRAAMKTMPDARFHVVANLPYRVSTAFIVALLMGETIPEQIVVTVQKEVADRICAGPGSKDYGYLSIMVQAAARAERLRTLPPRAFWPQPKVESAILRIVPDAALRKKAGDLLQLQRLAGGLFTHRRKQIARALILAGLASDRKDAARMLDRICAEPTMRPEELSVPKLIALARLLS